MFKFFVKDNILMVSILDNNNICTCYEFLTEYWNLTVSNIYEKRFENQFSNDDVEQNFNRNITILINEYIHYLNILNYCFSKVLKK